MKKFSEIKKQSYKQKVEKHHTSRSAEKKNKGFLGIWLKGLKGLKRYIRGIRLKGYIRGSYFNCEGKGHRDKGINPFPFNRSLKGKYKITELPINPNCKKEPFGGDFEITVTEQKYSNILVGNKTTVCILLMNTLDSGKSLVAKLSILNRWYATIYKYFFSTINWQMQRFIIPSFRLLYKSFIFLKYRLLYIYTHKFLLFLNILYKPNLSVVSNFNSLNIIIFENYTNTNQAHKGNG